MSLRQKAVKGVVWSIIESWGTRLITFSVFFLLARLLGAEAFGLVALASTYILFVSIFVDQGFSRVIIRHPDLEPQHLDTAFWTSLGFGVSLTLISILGANWLANIFNQPTLAPVIRWLSLSFLFSALISVQQGLFLRNLNFKALAVRSLVATVMSGGVGVGMAFGGYGVWSLVGKELVYNFVRVLMLWGMSDWRPSFKFSPKHFKELFNFGINILGIDILNFVSRRSDDFLIGYFLGPTALGYYTVAYRFLLMVIELLVGVTQKVAMPTFAKLQQEPEKLRNVLYQSTQLTTLISFPVFLGAAALAPEIIQWLLGDGWQQSIPVMQVLSLVGILQSIDYFNDSLIIAIGKPIWSLRLKAISTFMAFAGFITAIQIGAGIFGVSVSLAIANYLVFPISIFVIRKLTRIDVTKYLFQYLAPIAGTLAMFLSVLILKYFLFDFTNAPLRLIICSIAGSAVYLLIIAMIAPTLFKQVIELIKLIRPKPTVSEE